MSSYAKMSFGAQENEKVPNGDRNFFSESHDMGIKIICNFMLISKWGNYLSTGNKLFKVRVKTPIFRDIF
jgi:hypothetical protein